MGAYDFKDLKRHLGHDIECVAYGSEGMVWNVAVECTTCHEVLLDFDKEGDDASGLFNFGNIYRRFLGWLQR
jgi:hypothetical protein